MRVEALLVGAALFGGTTVLGQVTPQPNIKFITPPNIQEGEHDMRDNPVHEEGSLLPITWSPAPEGTRISLTLFQHNTTDGGSIGNFEYIMQGTVGITRHPWIVATTKDLKDSDVFRIILFIEGETGGHTGTEFFNITRKKTTTTTTTTTSTTTLPTSIDKDDESNSSSTSVKSTPTDTENSNNSSQTTNRSEDITSTSSGLSTGAAAGIGIGATGAVILLAGAAFYFFFFKPRQEKKQAALLAASGVGGAGFPSPGVTPHHHYSQVPSQHGPPSMYTSYAGIPPSVSPGPPGMTEYKPPNYYGGQIPPQPPSEMSGDWRGHPHEMAAGQMGSYELPGYQQR
ncbi:hypothetical protein QC761_507940 [Podospora bellae-mahoneyi]|uniref:Mid2 domain-containing protein n=1 Tax=Podospora bellae-mahoneyi TaxID=2093777 RepID=A0ABR0FGA5_9PEZI|nr:hypothetical protein QC761_507940 [Podospora bellae-mahoneyi]